MLPRRRSFALFSALFCVSFSLDAAAHISLDSPKSRYYTGGKADQSKLKYGPCGVSKDARTTNTSLITTFKPGEKITVKWRETIQHPGFFRIAFDSDGQDFTFPGSATNGDGVTILADKVMDKSGASNLEYTYDVTLPNMECTNCTLQLVQVMTTDPPPYEEGDGKDLYFNCADIILKSDGSGSGGAGGAGGGSSGGTSSAGNAGAKSAGGTAGGAAGASQGGAAGQSSGGQSGATSGGSIGTGGSGSGGSPGFGGATGAGGAIGQGGSTNAAGGAPASGGALSASGGSNSSGTSSGDGETNGCSCRVGHESSGTNAPWLALGLLALWRRRRMSKRAA